MEKLCEMLSRRQLMLVKKELAGKAPVSDDATLELVNQIGNKKYYRERGTTTQWQFDFRDGIIVGAHRRLNHFTAD